MPQLVKQSIPFALIVALVLLRLAVGWHFFSEGTKKLEPGFTSAHFLNAAKGPLAPLYQSLVTGPHDARRLLTEPREAGSLTPESAEAYARWQANYRKQAAAAVKRGEPLPDAENYSEQAPYAVWFERIREDWLQALQRFEGLPTTTDAQSQRARELHEQGLNKLLYYLDQQEQTIAETRHEAWRLEQLRSKAQDEPPPFYVERIRARQAELDKTLRPWMSQIERIEQERTEAVQEVAQEEGVSPFSLARIESALAEPTWLRRVDFLVTWTIIGCGVCLFLGLFTPLAALIAAGFLVSVLLSQFPGSPGADTTYFFYQVVEIAALLVVAAAGAGRWAGIGAVHEVLRKKDAPTVATSNPHS